MVVGVKGFPTRTNPKTKQGTGDYSGELSIAAMEVTLLSPCLHQVTSLSNIFAIGKTNSGRFPTTTTASRTPNSDSVNDTSIS